MSGEDGALHHPLVGDLSAGGARLLAAVRIQPGAPVPVLLYVPGHGLAFPTTARVVYAAAAPDGRWFHGVMFAAPMPADQLRALTATDQGHSPGDRP